LERLFFKVILCVSAKQLYCRRLKHQHSNIYNIINLIKIHTLEYSLLNRQQYILQIVIVDLYGGAILQLVDI